MGALLGRVTKGPLPPVPGGGPFPPGPVPGGPPPVPVEGARIVVSDLSGRMPRSVVTNDQGFYSISLPPETYRVTMAPLALGGFTKDLPATVTITAGQQTRLDILIDTGIR